MSGGAWRRPGIAAAFLAGVGCLAPVPAAATFSIVARDPATGELGVAVESRAFSVGMAVPWAEAGVGALATQALTNRSFGPRGLALLRDGQPAAAVLAALVAADPGRARRQLGMVDAQGRSAVHTGTSCPPWAGHRTGPDYAIQGNILAGEAVVREMERAFLASRAELARRLLDALEAGQAAGGDRRGQQSAALLVVRPSEEQPEHRTRYVDLRIEDAREPIRELARLLAILESEELLEAHLRYAAAYEHAGRAALARRERERIGEATRRALARGEDDAARLKALAWASATSGVFLADALAAAERAVARAPRDADALDTLAEVHFRMGDAARAVDAATRALEIEPGTPRFRERLARFRAATK